jgi:hypothetical protein
METEQGDVHIFSIYEPETRSTKFLYTAVQPENENPSARQIRRAEQKLQRRVNSNTAIVRYLGVGGSAVSMNASHPDKRHRKSRRA